MGSSAHAQRLHLRLQDPARRRDWQRLVLTPSSSLDVASQAMTINARVHSLHLRLKDGSMREVASVLRRWGRPFLPGPV